MHHLSRQKILTYHSKAGRSVRPRTRRCMASTMAFGLSLCTTGICEKFVITVVFVYAILFLAGLAAPDQIAYGRMLLWDALLCITKLVSTAWSIISASAQFKYCISYGKSQQSMVPQKGLIFEVL